MSDPAGEEKSPDLFQLTYEDALSPGTSDLACRPQR